MMIQRPDQRVAVFIDTQNMYHSAKHVFNSKVSFSALVEAVVGSRMMWSYSLGQRADFSMAYNSSSGREVDYERQVSLYGRWWFSPDWALAGEAVSRDQPGFLPRVQDFRIGVQRRF